MKWGAELPPRPVHDIFFCVTEAAPADRRRAGGRPAAPGAGTPARRRALLQRFAWLAAGRLAALEDPDGVADLRAALRVE
jgi:hypothetical protein